MRFINYNYAQLDETTVTASSSNNNFPASNIKHEFRNKSWRSNANGYFLIDSSNNKIDFKDASIGSELTATITSGEYTATTLATEIKNQLEVASSDTFTVSFSQTSGLWTVESDGSYLELLTYSGTNSVSNLLKVSLGFSNTDKTGALTYTGSNIAIHSQEHLTFDLRTTEEIDSIVLLWNKSGINLSSTASLKVQANATNNWTSPALEQVLTIDNTYSVASHFFTTSQTYRYWRVVIQDPSNPYLYVNLSVVVLGKALDIQEPDSGFEYEIEDQSNIVKNDYGNQFVDEFPDKATLALKYNLLTYEEAQALENAYRQNGYRKPVLAVIDETDQTFSKNHFLIYGKMIKPQKLSQLHYKYFGSSLIIEEIS